MGERTGRKEEFLAVWALSALTGFKCPKQPHLRPPPTHSLLMVQELHLSSGPGILPHLSHAVGACVLSRISWTNLGPIL